MNATRDERWGQVLYDVTVDEFIAVAKDPSAPILIDRPLSAGCILTGKCNLRCDFCYGNLEALPTQELTAKEWAALFRHLQSLGMMRLDLTGGEPTIRRDLGEIAESALDVGLHAVINTNGLLLCENGPRGFPKDVRFHVSLDSGFAELHAASRQTWSLLPSAGSYDKAKVFIGKCLDQGYRVRVLTCIGAHNWGGLFQLGQDLALLEVEDWAISRILKAGRAQKDYEERWLAADDLVLEQVQNMRAAYPWMKIRYSNRSTQEGYFLLVFPDGTLATQYTDGRDKVRLGHALDMTLEDLRRHPDFDLRLHAAKWIAATIDAAATSAS
jgi:MoaA/NifB/PqqE/SkfB family radical SAM enzyme